MPAASSCASSIAACVGLAKAGAAPFPVPRSDVGVASRGGEAEVAEGTADVPSDGATCGGRAVAMPLPGADGAEAGVAASVGAAAGGVRPQPAIRSKIGSTTRDTMRSMR